MPLNTNPASCESNFICSWLPSHGIYDVCSFFSLVHTLLIKYEVCNHDLGLQPSKSCAEFHSEIDFGLFSLSDLTVMKVLFT